LQAQKLGTGVLGWRRGIAPRDLYDRAPPWFGLDGTRTVDESDAFLYAHQAKVISCGKVVQRGNHDELMTQVGPYSELISAEG